MDDLLRGASATQVNGYGESRAGSATLLAQLGFADKDRQNGRHDLAVAYAGTRPRDICMLVPGLPEVLARRDRCAFLPETKVCRIDKQAGYHRPSSFLVGFADAIICWGRDGSYQYDSEHVVILEVKITPCSAGDIVRQVSAYRGGIDERSRFSLHSSPAIALLDFGLSEAEANLLTQNQITPLRLGPAFDTFVAEQKTRTADLPTF